MSIEAVLDQRRSDMESAIAIERMAHHQLGRKLGDPALIEEHQRCLGYVLEEIEKIERLRVSCVEVQELKAFALSWIEQTQGADALPVLREKLKRQIGQDVHVNVTDIDW